MSQKNLFYWDIDSPRFAASLPPTLFKRLSKLTRTNIEKVLLLLALEAGAEDPLGPIELITKLIHTREGVQLLITKEISDDLIHSDIGDVNFADVAFLSKTIEIYFEDPDLSTVLISRLSSQDIAREAARVGVTADVRGDVKNHIRILMENERNECCHLYADAEEFNALVTDDLEDMGSVGSLPLEAEERKTMQFLALLAYKVLVYASIPQFRPRAVSRNELHCGGEPGVCGRPRRPILKVQYLPSLRHEKEEYRTAESASHREFRGRRGFFRFYVDDRYVHVKGQRRFIPPVPGADGTYPKRQYRVTKVC